VDIQADRQTRPFKRQTDRKIDRQADSRQIDRLGVRQKYRQTDIHPIYVEAWVVGRRADRWSSKRLDRSGQFYVLLQIAIQTESHLLLAQFRG
jgi:hypothetical protein